MKLRIAILIGLMAFPVIGRAVDPAVTADPSNNWLPALRNGFVPNLPAGSKMGGLLISTGGGVSDWVDLDFTDSNLTDILTRNFSDLQSKPTTIAGYGITDLNSLGDARWAALSHAHTITLTGDVTGSGTGSFAATLANTAVTPGSYTNADITVDSKGRITLAANGSGGGGAWGDITGKPVTIDSIAGLDYTDNGLNIVRVNAAETGFELATVNLVSNVAFGVSWNGVNDVPPSKNTLWDAFGTTSSPLFAGLSVTGTAGVGGLTVSGPMDLNGVSNKSTVLADLGAGTVTSFSAGDLSPLFTTSEATATTTPALTFALSNAAAWSIFGNGTSGSAAPTFEAATGTGSPVRATSPTLAGATVTGQLLNSTAGAASAPASYHTGAIFTGGTGTTNFPHVFIQPTGTAASTTWSTAGTAIGVNAPTGFTGNLIDLQLGGASKFKVASTGAASFLGVVTAPGVSSTDYLAAAAASRLDWAGRARMLSPANGIIHLTNNGQTDFDRLQFGGTTSSFPALKRSTTSLAVRLADDSADAPITASNVTASGTLSVTGASTLTGGLIGGVQALSGIGAVNVTTVTTKLTSTGIAQALTLADGTNGQIKTIVYAAEGGGTDSMVLVPTTATGYTTITFSTIGNAVVLQYFTTQGWMIVSVYGATVT